MRREISEVDSSRMQSCPTRSATCAVDARWIETERMERLQTEEMRYMTKVELREWLGLGRMRHETCGFCVHRYR